MIYLLLNNINMLELKYLIILNYFFINVVNENDLNVKY